jgi:GDP/UDP-N,N'-diacetylbacillosamine 2-epimerase (hydrolysing)
MKLGILTSSRADFGIYRPLLDALKQDNRFDVELIAFGTHLSPYHGYTLDEIKRTFTGKIHCVEGMSQSDSATAISLAYATIHGQFASFWSDHQFDVVICLGDRYEMAAAVNAGIPHGIRFAHLHGGETTEGAIDNIYRHQISLASELHFTSTEAFRVRLEQLLGSNQGLYAVGALSLDGISTIQLPDWKHVSAEFSIPFDAFILTTFHPETGNSSQTEAHVQELQNALPLILKDNSMVVTMPNADTLGSVYRRMWKDLVQKHSDQLILVENFGRTNYFTAVKQSLGLLGNTSSGIIEAASLGKCVVNVGERQAGRPRSENTVDVPFEANAIVEAVRTMVQSPDFEGENVYSRPNTAQSILNQLYATL